MAKKLSGDAEHVAKGGIYDAEPGAVMDTAKRLRSELIRGRRVSREDILWLSVAAEHYACQYLGLTRGCSKGGK